MKDHSTTVAGNVRTLASASTALEVSALAGTAVSGDPARHCDSPAGDSGAAEEVKLMGLVARRDAEAQRQLTERLVRRVEGLCRAVLRGCADALYARQLSMLQILESAHAFRGASSIERWADRISVRTALRVACERRARGVPFDLEDDSADPTTEAVLLERQYLDHVSEQERMIIVLRHRLAYSIEEIVDLTGIAEKEVKASLLHARSVLRRMCRKGQLLVDASSSKAVG